MNIQKCFNLAKNASEFSDHKIKIGCILIYKNKVISVGYNTTKSHPIQKEYNIYRNTKNRTYDTNKMNNSLHAEMMCLLNAKKHFKGDFSKCSIYIYSTKKDGSTRLTRPCNACMRYIDELGIKNIYYTNNSNSYNYERRNNKL